MTDAPQEPTPAPSFYSSATPPPPVSPENAPVGTPGPASAPGPAPTPGLTPPPEPVRTPEPTRPPEPTQGGGVPPVPPEPPKPSPPKADSPKRSAPVGIIAALAVGALVGGVSGAGVALWATDGDSSRFSGSEAAPTSITVNDAENATTITAVAAKAAPSVVTISVTGGSSAGTGSGVILSADGYVLTNTHVVTLDGETGTGTIQVQTFDGRLLTAKIVGTDPIDDLAVIKIDGVDNLQPAEFANSSKLNVGDTAIAIGAPLGLANTVTNGIVSALNRSITVASSAVPDNSNSDDTAPAPDSDSPFDFWNFDIPGQENSTAEPSSTIALSVIQTDAAINPGNSGGALLDSNGKVIGINVAIASAGGSSAAGSIGVGFAIPANVAERISKELIATGKASHGLLGAGVVDVTDDPKQASATTVGASITAITSGGAAAAAGLQVGDIITKFDGIPITNKTDITAQVRVLAAGAKAEVTYVRDGNPGTATVTLGELK